ncbi:hypothetical protein VCHC41A1_2163, partial [Vibrio cholerae HC-41A1]
MRSTGIF